MNLLIFDMGGDWAFATPPGATAALPPLSIEGAALTWKLWRDGSATDAQWEAAKAFFLKLAGDLRKPGRRVRSAA